MILFVFWALMLSSCYGQVQPRDLKIDAALIFLPDQLVEHGGCQFFHIDFGGVHFLAAQPGQGQEIVDELPHLAGLMMNDIQVSLTIGVQFIGAVLQQHPGKAADGPERRPQVMGNRIGK